MTVELLKQVRILDPLAQVDQVADVQIEEGVITAIAPFLDSVSDSTHVQDAQGCILAPGLADLYSTVGEPGFETRETLQSLAQSAAAGGFTQVALLPNTHPSVDRPEQVAWMQAHSPADLPVRLRFWGALTQGAAGLQLVELAELTVSDICGFSDGQPLNNPLLLRRALEYLQPLQKPVALWPCDRTLAAGGVIREGVQALQTGLPESPTMAETTALAALLEALETLRTPVHLLRVSTARSVALIAAAKARGLPITASVTWMHLLWNSDDLHTYDVNLRLDPPLGNPEDQVALIQGLETGILDAIAIDHQAYTYEEKTVPFAEAPPGAIGLEFALPLLWETFVASQRWSAFELWRYLSLNPRSVLGLPYHPPTPGNPAELVLFDPHLPWQVTAQQLSSLANNTPYCNRTLQGRVLKTWLPQDNR